MKSHRLSFLSVIALTLVALGSPNGAGAENSFVGNWALTLPDGAPGWLGITQEKGYYDGGLLWIAGSVEPVSSVFFHDDKVFVTKVRDVKRKDANGGARTQQFTDMMIGHIEGDALVCEMFRPHANGEGVDHIEFTGKRIPPVPAAPDLSQVKFGEPIHLFNGRTLEGWRLINPRQKNGWVVENGVLANRPVQQPGQPHLSYGNLRTDREFEDFNLTLEARVPKGGNSGVYLRGIYEVQVADTYGRPLNPHNMGALYSRITPTVAAEKPAGEWQTLDITLVERHLTVILNGQKIIDNAPVLGCTGGALWSDEFRPGPIYLQGDHMAVEYRNIVLKPVVK